MIWNKDIIDLFKSYGFIFNNFPPSEEELILLSVGELKGYRDLKNIIETAYENREKHNSRIEEKTKNIKNALLRKKLTVEEIAEVFDTTIDLILQIKKDNNL